MATVFNFDGQKIKIPGVYSTIKSGVKNPPLNLPYGTLLIVDTGSGAGYGGGAGIAGTLSQNKDSIYSFDNIADFRNFAKGGLWWLLAQPLFNPGGQGIAGVSKILFVKAATTVPGVINFVPRGDGNNSISTLNGGTLVIKVIDEGVVGNGVLSPLGNLKNGYAAKMSSGVIDTAKFVYTFYRGSYTGDDQNGLSFDNIDQESVQPLIIAKSPEFNNVNDLIKWMQTDASFLAYFVLTSSIVHGDGSVDSFDLAQNLNYNLFNGGTEVYSTTTQLTAVLDAMADIDHDFILSDNYGVNAQSAVNTKLLTFIVSQAKFKPELYIASGTTINDFAFSKTTAKYWNNDSVSVVHGGIKKVTQQGTKFYDGIYKAAAMLGREAGLAPQVPITFKNLDYDGEQHLLSDKEISQSLDVGLLTSRLEDGSSFDITKGINSLQNNTYLLNEDGTTSSKQIKRIARQLNKGIKVNAKRDLLKQPNGVNRNTLSEIQLKVWTENYLTTRIATNQSDDLILSFRNVNVTRQGDAYFVKYSFVINSEISFIFETGTIVDL